MKTTILFAAILGSILTANVTQASTELGKTCQVPLKSIVIAMLKADGVTQIDSCGGTGTSYNCQIDFTGCFVEPANQQNKCSFLYTYGGAYPNYNEYVFVVDQSCQVQSASLERF